MRRRAAEAGVDLVEDHRLTTSYGGDRESDARVLAAGGGLRNRGERQTRIRPDEERNLVETGLARISLPQLGDELTLAQAHSDELAHHVLREARSRLAPRSAELLGEPLGISLGGGQRFRRRHSRVEAVLDRL